MNFTVYKSSAGSGKTYTLVKEYLKLALKSDSPREFKHILAITFTNKAASEMKERVLSTLKKLSEKSNPENQNPLKNDLLLELNISEPILEKRCRDTLEFMLHNYSDLSISTIDKFTHKIIRTFAHDLSLPVNFHVELEKDKMLAQAIDLLISRVGTDDQLTQILQDFVEKKADEQKNWEIENDLLSFSDNLLKEEGINQIKKLKNLSFENFIQIKKELKKHIHEFEESIEKHGIDGLNIIKKANISIKDLAGGANSSIAKYFDYLAQKRMDKLAPNNTLLNNISQSKWTSQTCKQSEKITIESLAPQMEAVFYQAQKLIQEKQENYIITYQLYKKIYGLSVLKEIESILDEIKKENNTIHISEFNKRIAAIIASEPAPFIYERLGERYKHFLIDEFQDTSMLQWQNILPLVDNSLANGHFNMVVGDGKQSIYRWRGGEVKQFSDLPAVLNPDNNPLLKEREQALKRNYKEMVLNKNYRSKAEVVLFNNHFFNSLAQQLSPDYQSIYHHLEQQYNEKNTGGYVEINFLEDPEKKDNIKVINCKKTLDIIKKAINDGYRYQDMTILCRTNKQGALIASYLIENEIPVISSESLLLGNNPDVNFIIHSLKWISDPENKTFRAIMAETILKVNKCPDQEFFSQITKLLKNTDYNAFETFLATWHYNINRNELLKKNLFDCCETLMRNLKLQEQPHVYLQFFLESVFHYSEKNDNNLFNFLTWWEEKGKNKSVIIPEGIDAVNIMTIHKSKGLEFPMVIFPFADWDIKNNADHLWIDLDEQEMNLPAALLPINKNLENTRYANLYEEERNKSKLDHLNVLYVALTRPESRLYILSCHKNSESVGMYLKKFLENTNQFEEGKKQYAFGEEVYREHKNKESKNEKYEPEINLSTDWNLKINISKQAGKFWDLDNESANNLKYGTLLHTALAQIKSNIDVIPGLKTMLEEGLINEQEMQQLEIKINAIINHPDISNFFQKGLMIKNEAEILLKDGSFYRPDRVILMNEKAVIIDYKTGKETLKHHEQLLLYGNLLIEMGYEKIEKYLIYTEELKIERI